jgi:hypothetical protein
VIREIAVDPFIFRWHVEQEGYEWKAGGVDAELRLFGRGGLGSWLRVYEPLKIPGLFLKFAKIRSAQNAILEFAGEYGDLFDSYSIEEVRVQRGRMAGGATLDTWKAEIGDMRALVRLWEAIRKPQARENAMELKRVITWAHGGVRHETKTPKAHQHSWLAHPLDPNFDAQCGGFKPGDVLLPARYALQREINCRIASAPTFSTPRLAWTPDYHQRLIFAPSNLLGAMWLQFAQAVTEEFVLKRCEECGRYFQTGPGGRRADAITCGEACRQRKSRHSKALLKKKTRPRIRNRNDTRVIPEKQIGRDGQI